ncbi:MAG: hypothetical protein KJO84_06665 [Acidimicrobiia bacterium]|nr:hypothetical protein [Acidimicrobiia bacterium]
MAYIDRVRDRFGPQLEPGEEIQAAVRGARSGWSPYVVIGAMAGFVIGYLVAGFIGYDELTTALGLGLGMMIGITIWSQRVSDDQFTAFFTIVATSRRLLVLERDEVWGRTKRTLGSYDRAEVAIGAHRQAWFGGTLDVTIDGTTHRLRFSPGQRLGDFVAAISR